MTASTVSKNMDKDFSKLFVRVGERRVRTQSASKPRAQKNVSKYLVSVEHANMGVLVGQIGLRVGRFVKRNEMAFVWVGFLLGWFLAFSGWLA